MSNPKSGSGFDRAIHTAPIGEIFGLLQTRPFGLTEAEVLERQRRCGRNAIHKVQGKPLYVKLLANFTHLMAILLWVGGIVAFIADMPQLGIAVWAVNLINGAFSFWQEFRAEKAIEALQHMLPQYVRVLRDGQEQRILAEELTPGDVMLLSEGDRISADGRLIEEAELRANQSTLTGESHPVRKTLEAVLDTSLSPAEVSNLVFAGTNVAAGVGKAIVFAVGMDTQFGKVAGLTQSLEEEPSPLQKEMVTLTRMISTVAVCAGLVFFALAVILAGINLAEGFIFGLGMIVAFVPEGLLPTVTLALAMGTQRMARRNALIKRLSAVETLGCATVICTDKTGTLTQNEMTVRDLWVAGQRLTVTGVGYAPEGDILDSSPMPRPVQCGRSSGLLEQDLRQLLTAAALCNNARLLPPDDESDRWTILGDPTEAALIVAAHKGGLDIPAEEGQTPRLRELPFDSRRKRMSTIHHVQTTTGEHAHLVYVKGSPREVLSLCMRIRRQGQDHPLEQDERDQILAANDAYARNGQRVLAVAMRTLAQTPRAPFSLSDYTPQAVENELIFLGLIAMMDPPRPEVAEAVARCHRAGIRVIMITGDYGLTAESIARRISIIQSERPRIVTGADLETMSRDDLKTALQDEVIFARVTPEHKLQVVTALQEMGEVVAVTGDGVNDAPALKKADIGVAMGLAGTDVAKEAADMILTDDNFASIVNAVEEGRAVYANIKKFTCYIFTSNTPEAVPFILFAFTRARIPIALNVMHILAVDLGTDIVPALALGAEPPEPGVMDRPPRNLKEHVITPALLLRAYVLLGPLQSLAVMAAFYYQYWMNGYWGQWLDLPAQGWIYFSAMGMALAAVVTTQIGNLFAQRAERSSIFHIGWFSNRWVWMGIASELVVIFAIIYVPILNRFIGTAPFALSNWLFLLAWAPSLWILDEINKAVRRWMARRQTRPTHQTERRRN